MIQGNVLAGSGYQITNSVRLRAAASAYFSRTFGAGGDRDKWWILIPDKRSTLGATQYLFGSDTASADAIYFNSSDKICVDIAGTNRLISTRVFRDPSAWGAFLVVFDASNGTNDLKLRVYYIDNGFAEITAWDTNTRSGITAGTAKTTLNTVAAVIGKNPTAASGYFDGYLSHFHIGTWSSSQPTPASFGGTDSNGVWVFSGASSAYGAQGSKLDFEDVALTSGSNVGLGKDVSGNGNYWTTNNISVTDGVTYDGMVDTPTNNYPTWLPQQGGQTWTFSNGALAVVNGNGGSFAYSCIATQAVSSGKWYWEVQCLDAGGTASGVPGVGIMNVTRYLLDTSQSVRPDVFLSGNGTIANSAGTALQSGFGNTIANDIVGVALDAGAKTVQFYRNGSALGTAQSYSPDTIAPSFYSYSGYDGIGNFGQRPFTYTPPTGFQALCTANLQPPVAPTASGSFTGNGAVDGPFVWIGGVPTTLTINGNAVTFGTHADKTAGGFKLRTSSASYNTAGSNTWTATFASPSTKSAFSVPQTAQGNP